MKDRVDLYGWGKGQAICHGGQLLINKEWFVLSRCELCGQVMGFQVSPFKPDLFTFFKIDWDEAFL